MRRIGIVLLAALATALGGCGSSSDVADVSGAWTGTMTDVAGARTVSGNCTQVGIRARCVLDVLDVARGTSSRGAIDADVIMLAGSPTLSYILAIPAPPCAIAVSGNAPIAGALMASTYGGSNSCHGAAVRDGRLALRRQ
jgi:hypothetical protein